MKPLALFLFAFLVIPLSACQTSLISELAVQPGGKIFWDNFSDTSGNWPQVSGPDGSMAIDNGRYRIRVLVPYYEAVAVPGHAFRDVQIEADAARLGGPMQNLFGLVCRSSDSANFYFFAVSSDGYYTLGKVKNAKTSLLGQEIMIYNSAIILGGGSNHLRLDCLNQTLKGYVNGQIIAISEDADFASGDVGLVAGALDNPGVDVAFDNFIVYKP